MKIINHPPQLIGRGQWGIWRVTVIYQDGHIHSADYEAFGRAEAMRRYLMEFGAVHQGCVYTEFIKKISYKK